MSKTRLLAHGAAWTMALAGAWAGAAAQTGTALDAAQASPPSQTERAGDTSGGDIVVTGSRIRHDPLEQPAPVTFVDQKDIARTGLSSIADVLQRLPSAAGGLNSRSNNSGNFGNPPDGGGVGAGAQEIDLRYLGSRRTLVLVDSLRFVNATSASGIPGSVDLNAIPNAAIERVEVLQDGASAIYGSDAISGVVNVITKQKQTGLIASAQHGLYDTKSGWTQNYDLSWGTGLNDGRTQIVVGGSYVRQQAIFASEYKLSQFPTPFATSCDSSCSSATPNGRFIVGAGDQTLIRPVAGRSPTLADFRDFTTADRYNFAPTNYILTPYERYGAFANLTQEIGSNTKFSGKFFYNKRTSRNQAAPLPLFVGPSAGNGNLLDTISIDATNPFNPYGQTLTAGSYDFIARRVVEGGPRNYRQSVESYYGAATLSGQFQLGAGTWYWDVNGVYGNNRARQTVIGNINAANLATALGPIAGCTGACVPFNIFGGAGTITPAMLNYVAFTQRDRSRQRLWDGTANLTGTIVDLPAGPLGIAVGYEHRDIKGSFDPDPIVAAGLGSDIPAQPSAGRINSDEVYGELRVPLLKDRPFFQALNANFAVRYSDYNLSGSETTIKAGGDWKPTRDILVRGGYAQGFRAPSVGELFGTPSRFDQELDDPCSADSSSATNIGNSAAVLANCRAQGVPAGYVQQGSQKPVITGGSRDLDAEKSRSYNVGGVYNASWARGFARSLTLEATYYHIKVKDAIQAIDATTLLGRCVQNNDTASCSTIQRSASGQITRISGLLGNIAAIKTDGIDVTLNYRSPESGFGTFGLAWNNNFMLNYTLLVPATVGTTRIEREGTERGSPDQAFPRYKSNLILDWSLGAFSASATGRYISGVTETTGLVGHKLGRRLYTDVTFTFSPTIDDRSFAFTLGVNNLSGVSPPNCYSCGLNNFDPTTYDIPGQFFYIRAAVRI